MRAKIIAAASHDGRHKIIRMLGMILPSIILPFIAPDANSAFSFEIGTTLPCPRDHSTFVRANRFSLIPTQLSEETKVLIFFYSASWCAPCGPIGKALTEAYPEINKKVPQIEFATYSVDFSPRARSEYLRESHFPWPAIEPSLIDNDDWLQSPAGGTPQFQAFAIQGKLLVALTDPGDAVSAINAALRFLQNTHGIADNDAVRHTRKPLKHTNPTKL